MWPWLQKRLSKKALLLSKLVGFATSMHLLIFLCSIVVYHFRSETRLTINIAQRLRDTDATVVVLPFQKQVKQAMHKVAQKTKPRVETKKTKAPTT